MDDLKARGHLLVCARVDRDDNALTAVLFRRCVHQIGVFDRRGVDGDLVRTGAQDLAEIVHRADAAADRELIGLAEAATAAGQRTPTADRLLADGLFTTLTNVNFDNRAIAEFTARVRAERDSFGGAPCKVVELWKRPSTLPCPP